MKEISFEFKIPKIQFSGELKQRLRIGMSIILLASVLYVGMVKFDFTLAGALILAYFLLSFIWRLDSRISAALALLFLVGCPILIYFKNDALAETFAIYAFYFLVITVSGEVVSLIGDKSAGEGAVLLRANSRSLGAVDNSPRQRKRKVV